MRRGQRDLVFARPLEPERRLPYGAGIGIVGDIRASSSVRRATRLLAILVVVAGCRARPASTGTAQVSVADLGTKTDHLVFFNYVGSDADFHYFTTAEGNRYKVSLAEWTIPRPFPLDGGMELFMTVKDGKLTVPDPKEMATLSEEELLHRPYKKKRR